MSAVQGLDIVDLDKILDDLEADEGSDLPKNERQETSVTKCHNHYQSSDLLSEYSSLIIGAPTLLLTDDVNQAGMNAAHIHSSLTWPKNLSLQRETSPVDSLITDTHLQFSNVADQSSNSILAAIEISREAVLPSPLIKPFLISANIPTNYGSSSESDDYVALSFDPLPKTSQMGTISVRSPNLTQDGESSTICPSPPVFAQEYVSLLDTYSSSNQHMVGAPVRIMQAALTDNSLVDNETVVAEQCPNGIGSTVSSTEPENIAETSTSDSSEASSFDGQPSVLLAAKPEVFDSSKDTTCSEAKTHFNPYKASDFDASVPPPNVDLASLNLQSDTFFECDFSSSSSSSGSSVSTPDTAQAPNVCPSPSPDETLVNASEQLIDDFVDQELLGEQTSPIIDGNIEESITDDVSAEAESSFEGPRDLSLPTSASVSSAAPCVAQARPLTTTHDLGSDPSKRLTESELQLGKVAPYWIADQDSQICMICEAKFTVIRRRHHCRACGRVLCGDCCNKRFKLPYLDNKEAKVCNPCLETLQLIEVHEKVAATSSASNVVISTTIGPDQGDVATISGENPNEGLAQPVDHRDPSQYCTPGPPPPYNPDQPAPLLLPVMVPSVLKRAPSGKGSKQVMFSDGIKPGGDLREGEGSGSVSTSSTFHPPPVLRGRNAAKQKSQAVAGLGSAKQRELQSYFPEKQVQDQIKFAFPPLIQEGTLRDMSKLDQSDFSSLVNMCKEHGVQFMLKRNLRVVVRLTTLSCCTNQDVWSFASCGLHNVGQDELLILLQREDSETVFPTQMLEYLNFIYDDAYKGNLVQHLDHTIVAGTPVAPEGLFGSRTNVGFLYVRHSMQCLKSIQPPQSPYCVAVLIQRSEVPWAKVFPLRLLLRLGAEFRCYPCPLISVRSRKPVFFEIGQTIVSLLADFRNFSYTLPELYGAKIHLREGATQIILPKNRYNQVTKILNSSNEHVLAFAVTFSAEADSHLVCFQNQETSLYETQMINIEGRSRQTTGASFVIFNGALKAAADSQAKCSIVEDGIMIQMRPDTMLTLREKLRNQENYTLMCGDKNESNQVEILWVSQHEIANKGCHSPIDGKCLDNCTAITFSGRSADVYSENKLIRLTDVYVLQNDEQMALGEPANDFAKIARTIAAAAGVALLPYGEALSQGHFCTIGIRVCLGPDSVEYSAGACGETLPPVYMCSLDDELIPVLHAQMGALAHPIQLELILRILDL